MAVTFAPAAKRDIREIGDYINSDSPAAALRFVARLRERCARLDGAPLSGMPRTELMEGLRSTVFLRYLILYSVVANGVRIERVLHGARDIMAAFDPEA